MDFALFNQLYSEALESPSMESCEAQDIADILSTIHSLANSTLAESRGGSRAEFARKFDIPIRTLEDWDSGKRSAPEYIRKLIDYVIFIEIVQEKVQEKIARRKEKA